MCWSYLTTGPPFTSCIFENAFFCICTAFCKFKNVLAITHILYVYKKIKSQMKKNISHDIIFCV